MNRTTKLVGSITVFGVLWAEVGAFTSAAQAASWSRTYDCGNAAVTVTEQAPNLYTYEAVNARGQKLVVNNGTYNHDRSKRTSTYTFHNEDTVFTVRETGKGKAELITRAHGTSPATFSCTVMKTRSVQPSGGQPRTNQR